MKLVAIARNGNGRFSEPFYATERQLKRETPESFGQPGPITFYAMPKSDWTGCGWDYETFVQVAPIRLSTAKTSTWGNACGKEPRDCCQPFDDCPNCDPGKQA